MKKCVWFCINRLVPFESFGSSCLMAQFLTTRSRHGTKRSSRTKLNSLLCCDTYHWITPPPQSQGGHQTWCGILQSAGSTKGVGDLSLPLYKNSPRNPGAGDSWEGGHSQFRVSRSCLAQSHQVALATFSHDTHSAMPGGDSRRVSERGGSCESGDVIIRAHACTRPTGTDTRKWCYSIWRVQEGVSVPF